MAPHLILQAWWFKTAAGIETKATPEATIANVEARYRVALPADFRQYLGHGGPTAENWDAEDGNWWPAERIKNIPDEYKHPVSAVVARNSAKHLVFIDYSIWSWAWAISCAEDETYGRVAIIGSRPDGYVADSFAEFVERYTTDWTSVSRVSSEKLTSRFRTWFGRR